MLRELVIGLLGIVALAYAIEVALCYFDDPREPRRISSRTPLLGHLIGLSRMGPGYYTEMSNYTNEEIFTLGIFNMKLYIANTPRLFGLVQKTKSISFDPIMQRVSRNVGDVSDQMHALMESDIMHDYSAAMRDALLPGLPLDEQNARMGNRALIEIHETSLRGTSEIDLLAWSKHAIIQATSCGLYGERHPFREPEVEAAYLVWEHHFILHMLGLDFFRKGFAARDKVFEAMMKYNTDSRSTEAAEIIKVRQRVMRENGASETDIHKQDALLCTAIFPNTVPTFYWTMHEMYARPELLEQVRREIISEAVEKTYHNGYALNVSNLKTKCPLLLSVMQETQRTRHTHAALRVILEDTILDDRYLLKKGNYLMMPGQPAHLSTKLWGPDADIFNPYRFMEKKTAPSSFVPWGLAPNLCPARQFASVEILIFVALMVTRFDMVPLTGTWDLKPKLNTEDFATLPNPLKGIRVRLTPREEGIREWTLEIGESKTRISLASG